MKSTNRIYPRKNKIFIRPPSNTIPNDIEKMNNGDIWKGTEKGICFMFTTSSFKNES